MSVDSRALFIAFVVIDSLAMISTLFRLSFRLHIQRFWWEDAWAVVVFMFGTTFFVSQFISSASADYEAALIASWITSSTFTSAVWAVRMSLLYSTIRVIPPSSFIRTLSRALAVVFVASWTTLIVLKTWWCFNIMSPTPVPGLGKELPMCVLSEPIVFLEVITDLVSDGTLVVLSLKLLWRVKLPRRQRRMILSLFSSSIITSMFSLFHAISEMVADTTIMFVAFNLELTSALVVCNLLVLVTYVYRVVLVSPRESIQSESETSLEDDDFTTRTPGRTATLVITVEDLNTLPVATEVA